MSKGIHTTTQGMVDVISERVRQIEIEGYKSPHDDKHDGGELSLGAVCYADIAGAQIRGAGLEELKPLYFCGHHYHDWPWEEESFKPSDDPRRNLVKAAALILAEIDRIDRKNGKDATPFRSHGEAS